MANESFRHHYIPQFHLNRWADPDGQLAVFQYRHDKVRGSMKTPAQTGYEWRLYSSDEFDRPDQLEKDFMAPVDQIASEAVEIYIAGKGTTELGRRAETGTPLDLGGESAPVIGALKDDALRVAATRRAQEGPSLTAPIAGAPIWPRVSGIAAS